MHNELVEFINNKVAGANATTVAVEAGDASITVDGAKLFQVCEALKNEKGFKVLEVVGGTDFKDYIEVAYVIATFDPANSQELILKIKLDRNAPEVESVCKLWNSANFLERETYDMMGVIFKNHPDLRRILCPEDWTGFPLRKDYVVQEVYNGMVVNPEHKMNIPDREFAAKQKAAEKAATGTTTAAQTPVQ
ncbi:MAG: NADH-quinone oxidoreductase subunit C [Bacteriovoracaceae bacterium]